MLKAVKVILSDGREILVHEPKTTDIPTFLRATPAFDAVSKYAEAFKSISSGVIVPVPDVSPQVWDLVFPLMAVMTDIPVDEVRELSAFDGIAIIEALQAMMPNFQKTSPSTQPASATTSQVGLPSSTSGESSGEIMESQSESTISNS